MGSIETVAVLFTDLVGSTALSSQLGPVAADELRREHFALLRQAIEEVGGREVKNLGDGLMVVFGTASTAVRGAVAMQQRIDRRNRRAEEQLGVRVGISLGEADCEDGDYFGRPVIEASRLCAAADGGQILAAELVRAMSAGREGDAFESVGELELKGLPDLVTAFEVSWRAAAEAGSEQVALPARLRGVPPISFVGRDPERELLMRLWDDAQADGPRVALLSGEPGIGKTRLATHTALAAYGSGATVLYGGCDEDLGLPYGPWIEALGHYVEHAPAGVLEAHVERHGGELARLVPALAARAPNAPAPRSSDPEMERYLLFAAVLGLLEQASANAPVVLIIDDLHWADRPTLALLKRLAAGGTSMRLLALGTFRSSELARGHPLGELLAELRRVDCVERIQLGGLEESDVISLMQAAAGHELEEPGLRLAAQLVRETDGNPFYVAELLRHLHESGALYLKPDGRWEIAGPLDELGLPDSVRDVIGQRVDRLGDEVETTLTAGAVIGREFEVELLAEVTGSGEDDLLDVLEEAVAAAVVAESAERPGLFRFAHALVNYALYERLGTTRRARLHRRVAEALERLCADDLGPRLGELAHHWANAPAGGEKAVEYACRAGARALDELAPDEALRWFARAEELSRGGAEPGTRAEILIGVGEAQRQVGDSAYRETLLEACRVASALGDGDRLARAALANNRGFASSYGEVDDERVAALDAALAAVGDRDPARRARLLSLLALELNFSGDLDRRLAAADEAIAVARGAGDPRALAYVLEHSMSAAWIPEMAERRREWALELGALADRLDDPAIRVLAMIADGSTALEAADGERSERALARARALADELGQPVLRWSAMHYHAARLALSGRLDEAETVAQAAAQVGLDSGQPDAFMMYGAQISLLRTWQGRADEIIELLKQAADDNPGLPAFRAGVANVLALMGRGEEARPMIERALAQRFEMPRDQVWLSAVAIWAEAAADAGVRTAAPRLYELLEPHADLVVWAGGIAYGSTAYYLARLADLLGDHAGADRHFSRSIEVNESLCSPPCVARTEARWGEALLRRGDRALATSLLERAAERAGACGAGVYERRARELLGATV